MSLYASIAVARPFPEPLTYAVPALLAHDLRVGHMVLVPLGRTGETGYVVGLTDEPGMAAEKIRPITRLLDPECAFDARQLAFFAWIADYYLQPLGMVIHTAMPSRMKAKVVLAAEPTQEGIQALTVRAVEGAEAQVLREVINRPGLTKRALSRRLASELEAAVVKSASRSLRKAGLLQWVEREIGETKSQVRVVRLTVPLATALSTVPSRAGIARQVLVALDDGQGELDLRDLANQFGSGARSAVKRLLELELVEETEREKRDPLMEAAAQGPAEPPPLNDDQQRALGVLRGLEGAALLFGVTGSGKTEVFLGAAREVLDRGQQVLVLVPEIGLTPQLVGRFKARFGDAVAVLHSGLTGHQRLAEWRRIRAGEAPVAVGARSALFAPFDRLGLVVVDEEHDDSYKQDEGVPYSARDLAVVLGLRHRCTVVLATATPSLESWSNAEQGRYVLVELPRRATPRPVPQVELVDMTQLTKPEGKPLPMFAPIVVDALRQTFAKGGKAIVLYNRRGYATSVQCLSCGAGWECPNCGISMTLHKRFAQMCCHYCGLKLAYSDACPVCHAETQEESGKGTEQVAETLAELFPSIPMARMDADTTTGRGSHQRILDGFRAGETRMLVGTQIVAKGHDFPDVHTAVVVSADRGFRIPDFRAAERTFALLVQVAGRAGRGDTPGRVFVQTWKPDHYVLEHLHDVRGFLRTEMRLRGTLAYPPFARLCLVRVDGIDRQAVERASRDLARELRALSGDLPRTAVLGPAAAALPRLVGRWRFQIILRGQVPKAFRVWLRRALPVLRGAASKGIRVSWDVDPRNLM